MNRQLTHAEIRELAFTLADVIAGIRKPTLWERMVWRVKAAFTHKPAFHPNFIVDSHGTAFRPL